MSKDVWSEDRVQREIALQQRSDAVANDRMPSINALAPQEQDPKVVLVRRVSDGWLEAKFPDEAERLIQSGDYRPFAATDGVTENGTLCCQADPEDVEYSRKERIRAIVLARARADMDAMAIHIAGLSDEEIREMEQSLVGAQS